ncbi:MAG: hypothetical protein IJD64_05640 [Clostridia bacterium]|nr:hypothetical protein [Clostridia bacterium]
MEISPIRLFFLLISSFFLGLGVGGLYDIHRIIRVLFGVQYTKNRPSKFLLKPLPIIKRPLSEIRCGKAKSKFLGILIFFQDIFLCCVSAMGVVILNYTLNDGRFRFYTVIALVLGCLLYYFTVGKLVIFLSEWIVFFIRAAFSIFFYLLSRPGVIFFRFLGKIVKKMGSNLQKTIANQRKKVYNINKVKDCFEAAEHGFL